MNELYANEQDSDELNLIKTNKNEVPNCTGSSKTAVDENARVEKCSTESQISSRDEENQNFNRSHSNKEEVLLQKNNIEQHHKGASKT